LWSPDRSYGMSHRYSRGQRRSNRFNRKTRARDAVEATGWAPLKGFGVLSLTAGGRGRHSKREQKVACRKALRSHRELARALTSWKGVANAHFGHRWSLLGALASRLWQTSVRPSILVGGGKQANPLVNAHHSQFELDRLVPGISETRLLACRRDDQKNLLALHGPLQSSSPTPHPDCAVSTGPPETPDLAHLMSTVMHHGRRDLASTDSARCCCSVWGGTYRCRRGKGVCVC